MKREGRDPRGLSRDTNYHRAHLLARRRAWKRELTKLVKEAVRWRVFDHTVSETKARNAAAPAKEIEFAIDEALAAVRVAILRPKMATASPF
jgi:hypothetical protein